MKKRVYHVHMNSCSYVCLSIKIARHSVSERWFIMKKKFKLQDLDCANCAAKMEEAIKKIEGVTDASVSFMTQKMMIEAPDEQFDSIVDEAIKVIAKVEPDCVVLV